MKWSTSHKEEGDPIKMEDCHKGEDGDRDHSPDTTSASNKPKIINDKTSNVGDVDKLDICRETANLIHGWDRLHKYHNREAQRNLEGK